MITAHWLVKGHVTRAVLGAPNAGTIRRADSQSGTLMLRQFEHWVAA